MGGALVAGAGLAADTKAQPRPGCQTNAWNINPANFASLLDVLGRIKKHGFEGYETSFRNLERHFANPEKAKAALAATGLRLIGLHIFLQDYDPETAIAKPDLIEQVMNGAVTFGAERLILSGGGVTHDGRLDRPLMKRKCEALNRVAGECRKKGIGLAYHNHPPEFANRGLEIGELLDGTDSSTVELMFDAGHAYSVGANVVRFFESHAKRICGLHLRDFRSGDQVPLGQGEFDLRQLAKQIQKLRWGGWIITEEERATDFKPGDEAVGPARAHLKKIFGI